MAIHESPAATTAASELMLLDRDVALYAAHIPLDVHPEVGNNAAGRRTWGSAT